MSLSTFIKKVLGVTPAPELPRFGDLAAMYGRRLQQEPAIRNGSGARVGVLITPWMFTAVPFFSLEVACLLADAGLEVTLLWDYSNVIFNTAKQREIDAVGQLVAQASASFRVIDVSARPGRTPSRADFLEEVLYENAVRQQRGESNAADYLRDTRQVTGAMRDHAGRVEGVLQEEAFDWLFIPGGIWASSGLYSHVARSHGISFTTFDSGIGALYVAQDGVAAHFADVSRTYRQVAATASAADRQVMIDAAHAVLRERMAGRDVFRLQPKASGGPDSADVACDLLAPLNYRSDSAALCRQRLFASVTDWLEQSLVWMRSQGGASIAIRQHPCERIPQYRGSDDWRLIFAPYADLGERFRFVAAEDPINTYDLMTRARAVLPYTSRVGVEAGMLGIPVILSARCYYEECDFAHRAETREEYFGLIQRALRGELPERSGGRDAAAIVYFIVERCLGLATPFTPQPKDFVEWLKIPRETLWNSPAVATLRRALVDRNTVAMNQFQEKLAEARRTLVESPVSQA